VSGLKEFFLMFVSRDEEHVGHFHVLVGLANPNPEGIVLVKGLILTATLATDLTLDLCLFGFGFDMSGSCLYGSLSWRFCFGLVGGLLLLLVCGAFFFSNIGLGLGSFDAAFMLRVS
jgi:hypothetical protein